MLIAGPTSWHFRRILVPPASSTTRNSLAVTTSGPDFDMPTSMARSPTATSDVKFSWSAHAPGVRGGQHETRRSRCSWWTESTGHQHRPQGDYRAFGRRPTPYARPIALSRPPSPTIRLTSSRMRTEIVFRPSGPVFSDTSGRAPEPRWSMIWIVTPDPRAFTPSFPPALQRHDCFGPGLPHQASPFGETEERGPTDHSAAGERDDTSGAEGVAHGVRIGRLPKEICPERIEQGLENKRLRRHCDHRLCPALQEVVEGPVGVHCEVGEGLARVGGEATERVPHVIPEPFNLLGFFL